MTKKVFGEKNGIDIICKTFNTKIILQLLKVISWGRIALKRHKMAVIKIPTAGRTDGNYVEYPETIN